MKFNQIAFQNSMEALQNETKKLGEEISDMQDDIEDIIHDVILIPFGETCDLLYNGLYDMATEVPEILYRSVDPDKYADYDKYYNMG